MSHSPKTLVNRLLDVNLDDVLPLTAANVAKGCKVFGAAILNKSDLSLVMPGTNNEIVSPLLASDFAVTDEAARAYHKHGEINTIQQFYAMPERPLSKDCVFYATHEPCSLCLSGITWGGFDNIYYLFTQDETGASFDIPHDVRILEEVFKTPNPGETPEQYHARPYYNKKNAFFTSTSIDELIAQLDPEDKAAAEAKVAEIRKQYAELSQGYQQGKGNVGIPLA